MPYILIRHKIKDYAKWKPVFAVNGLNRRAMGSLGSQLFRCADNPDELVILLEWDDLEGAREYIQSDDFREALERGGISDEPDVYLLGNLEKLSM